jgi:hypothetical protein
MQLFVIIRLLYSTVYIQYTSTSTKARHSTSFRRHLVWLQKEKEQKYNLYLYSKYYCILAKGDKRVHVV